MSSFNGQQNQGFATAGAQAVRENAQGVVGVAKEKLWGPSAQQALDRKAELDRERVGAAIIGADQGSTLRHVEAPWSGPSEDVKAAFVRDQAARQAGEPTREHVADQPLSDKLAAGAQVVKENAQAAVGTAKDYAQSAAGAIQETVRDMKAPLDRVAATPAGHEQSLAAKVIASAQSAVGAIRHGAQDAVGAIKENAHGVVGVVKEKVWGSEQQSRDSKAESDRQKIGAAILEHQVPTLRHVEAPCTGPSALVREAFIADRADRRIQDHSLTTKVVAGAQDAALAIKSTAHSAVAGASGAVGAIRENAQGVVGAVKEKVWGHAHQARDSKAELDRQRIGTDILEGQGHLRHVEAPNSGPSALVREAFIADQADRRAGHPVREHQIGATVRDYAQDAVGAIKEKVWGGDQHALESKESVSTKVAAGAQEAAGAIKENTQSAVGAVKDYAQSAVGAIKEKVWGSEQQQARDSKAEHDRQVVGTAIREDQGSTLRHVDAPDSGPSELVKEAFVADQAARQAGEIREHQADQPLSDKVQPLSDKVAAGAQAVKDYAQSAVGAIKEKVWGSEQQQARDSKAELDRERVGTAIRQDQGSTLHHVEAPDSGPSDHVKAAFVADQVARPEVARTGQLGQNAWGQQQSRLGSQ